MSQLVGMHAQARDRLRVAEIGEVIPLHAAVGRLVDAVALDDVAAQLRFAAADVDDVGVRLADRQRADRRGADLAVGHRRPVGAAVGGLPRAAAGGAEPVFERPRRRCRRPRATARRARDRRCATACRCRGSGSTVLPCCADAAGINVDSAPATARARTNRNTFIGTPGKTTWSVILTHVRRHVACRRQDDVTVAGAAERFKRDGIRGGCIASVCAGGTPKSNRHAAACWY